MDGWELLECIFEWSLESASKDYDAEAEPVLRGTSLK